MKDYLTHLNLSYNKTRLLLESDLIEFKPLALKSPKAKGTPFEYMPTWEFGHMRQTFGDTKRLVDKFEKMFDVDIKPRFLKQHAHSEIPMHADHGTISCINILLSDTYAPITFEDIGDVTYECALVNVAQRHAVKSHPEERILLKLSIFDKSYEDVLKIVDQNGLVDR